MSVTTAPPSALSVEGVSHSYGARRALADVTFAVKPASFTVLLGLNGAGKSTLFSLVDAAVRHASGPHRHLRP